MKRLYQVDADTTAIQYIEADSPEAAIAIALERSKFAVQRLTSGLYNPRITGDWAPTPDLDAFVPEFDEDNYSHSYIIAKHIDYQP